MHVSLNKPIFFTVHLFCLVTISHVSCGGCQVFKVGADLAWPSLGRKETVEPPSGVGRHYAASKFQLLVSITEIQWSQTDMSYFKLPSDCNYSCPVSCQLTQYTVYCLSTALEAVTQTKIQ